MILLDEIKLWKVVSPEMKENISTSDKKEEIFLLAIRTTSNLSDSRIGLT